MKNYVTWKKKIIEILLWYKWGGWWGSIFTRSWWDDIWHCNTKKISPN